MILHRLDPEAIEALPPGSNVVLLSYNPTASVGCRRLGLELRDTMLLVGPTQVEFAYLFRKELVGTVAENVMAHGTGGLNIDGCRIDGPKPARSNDPLNAWHTMEGRVLKRVVPIQTYDANQGRWPTNLVFVHRKGCGDECAPDCFIPALDEQGILMGVHPAGSAKEPEDRGSSTPGGALFGAIGYKGTSGGRYGDRGTASRFFPQFASVEDLGVWLRTLIGDIP